MPRSRSSYRSYKPRGFIGALPVLFRLTRFLSCEVPLQMEMLNARSAKTMSTPAAGPLDASSEPTISLSKLERGVTATVAAIDSPATDQDRELVLRLIEIGFVPGETLRCGTGAMHKPVHNPRAATSATEDNSAGPPCRSGRPGSQASRCALPRIRGCARTARV